MAASLVQHGGEATAPQRVAGQAVAFGAPRYAAGRRISTRTVRPARAAISSSASSHAN